MLNHNHIKKIFLTNEVIIYNQDYVLNHLSRHKHNHKSILNHDNRLHF